MDIGSQERARVRIQKASKPEKMSQADRNRGAEGPFLPAPIPPVFCLAGFSFCFVIIFLNG